MSKNHAKELFGKFNENTDDYDKYIDTVKYCESIEDEIRSEENVKFHAKLRRLEGLLSCPNWRERKNDMLSLIHKVQAEIELKYGDCIAKESKTMCSQVGKHIKGEDNGKNNIRRENNLSEVYKSVQTSQICNRWLYL